MSGPGHDLLVASAGGHLTQLWLVANRLTQQRRRTWVTYDHPQAASLLRDEDVIIGHGPSSRSVSKAVRNWSLARRVLANGRFDRVISTGSAIAVPFLLEANRRGLPAHYLESATRATGPSLSGRILQRSSSRVALHTQHARWADARWHPVPSVFDGFASEQDGPRRGPLKVVVSLGTHRFPFSRLLLSLGPALRAQDEVLLQHGSTPPADLPGVIDAVESLPVDELARRIETADVVVAHAGTGIALTAMAAGHRPVLVPRRSAYGEHVDDHQAVTARELADRGLAHVVEADQLDRSVLRTAAGSRVVHGTQEQLIDLTAYEVDQPTG